MRTPRERLRLSVLRLAGWMSRWAIPSSGRPITGACRVLLIRPDHLGDLLLATPAFHDLHHMWPDARLCLLVGPWSAPIVADNPDLNEVLTCEFPGFSKRPKGTPLAPYIQLLRTARQIRAQRFDLAVVLRFDHWGGAALSFLARVPRRIGYDVAECRPFLSNALGYQQACHEVEQNLRLTREAVRFRKEREDETGDLTPLAPSDLCIQYRLLPGDLDHARGLLRESGMAHGDLTVCIHPGAGAATKRWPAGRFAAVGDALSREFGARILVTGSPAETDLSWKVAALMREPCVVLAGRTSIGQLAAVLTQSCLVIGSDSGPLHLAAGVGVRTIHLYGPADPKLFGPWGDPERHMVLASPKECAPCNRLDWCADGSLSASCMEMISVECVLVAAREALRTATGELRGEPS